MLRLNPFLPAPPVGLRMIHGATISDLQRSGRVAPGGRTAGGSDAVRALHRYIGSASDR